MRWVTLFSQTGKEIADISDKINRFPDLILSNRQSLDGVDSRIKNRVKLLSRVPLEEEYFSILEKTDLITLHGFLRILPSNVCGTFMIYNGHPGLINKFPFLKGKDPQKKAYDLQLESSGCVIHRVIPEVDEGEIIKSREVLIKNLTLEELFIILKNTSLDLWVEFLKGEISCIG